MPQWLISLIAGPFIKGALDAYQAKLTAGNDHDRIVADLVTREAALQQREAELAAQVLVAEQGHWFTRWVRPVWAAPFVFWTWKVVVWDICLGYGSTPELKGITAQLCLAVSVAYFGGRTIEKTASVIADAMRR